MSTVVTTGAEAAALMDASFRAIAAGATFVYAETFYATDAVADSAVTGEAKTGMFELPAYADALPPRSAGPLPPTNGSTSVSTAVNIVVSNAKRFITVPPNPEVPIAYPE